MLLLTVIKIDHEWVLFSESIESQIYFELASISKNREFELLRFYSTDRVGELQRLRQVSA